MRFGKKIQSGFNRLGKKIQSGEKLGKKVLHVLDEGERKLVNTIDKIAPVVATGADLYMPGSGEAILKANDGLQSAHASGRRTIKNLDKIARGTRQESRQAITPFKDSVNVLKGDLRNVRTNLGKVGKEPPAPDVLLQQ